MVQIEILSGPDSGQIFDLSVGTHTLGRAATSSHVLGVESVSGRHLELIVSAAGEIRFRDLGSTNGTWSGGVQVADGEWFPGSELKLGNCVLRFVAADGAASATSTADSDADSDIHRRAREAAMSGKRKGGPLQMALGLVLVIAAGGGAWWTFGRSAENTDGSSTGSTATADHGVSSQALDSIDGFGNFEEPEAWTLSKGVSIADGALQAHGGLQMVRLSREFDCGEGALNLRANVSGTHAYPLISWGKGEQGSPVIGVWEGGDLAQGTVTLSLPSNAEWFQLALRLDGQGSVRNLTVETTSGALGSIQSPLGNISHEGANLLLANSSGTLLTVRGQNGSWSSDQNGLLFTPNGTASLLFTAAGELLLEGPFLLLADGGPVGLAPGVKVEASPGILLGGGAKRLLIDLEQATGIQFLDGGAALTTSEALHLRWDLAQAMTQAARLAQSIKRAEREGDDRQLLAAAADLLRNYPLDELKVQDALLRSREALERGRAQLAVLQLQASGAVFVGAGSLMAELAIAARELSKQYPGTAIAPQATVLADDLEIGAERAEEGTKQAAEQYRERLQGALASSYPVLAAWLKEAN
jgi:hypothetical protein